MLICKAITTTLYIFSDSVTTGHAPTSYTNHNARALYVEIYCRKSNHECVRPCAL